MIIALSGLIPDNTAPLLSFFPNGSPMAILRKKTCTCFLKNLYMFPEKHVRLFPKT